MVKRVGILTGGGDCPGLNAVIRAVTKKGINVYGYEIIGILEGWKGLLEGLFEPLTLEAVSGILPKGGTILKTSRTNPFKNPAGVQKVVQNLEHAGIDALIAAGGEDTLGVAKRLYEMNVSVVGVPKTIDNDICGTDYTFGFDTAINIVMDAIDKLHSTAESHNRVMVIEVMGRHTGWIAVEAGIAGGADVILIPEAPLNIDEVCETIKRRHDRGRDFSIVVVAEGVEIGGIHILQDQEKDAFGHVRLGGIGHVLAREIEQRTGYETRVTVLGHLQRGGSPSAFDRLLATRLGVGAIDMVHDGQFGKMVAIRGNEVVSVDLSEAVAKLKTVNREMYDIAKIFFG
ncbi:MAG: 6-phosphofructokinase [Candidatus Latescibacteria bacterium]|nr:6-phosphofructokinase [Candidatus Latescibacterota bacterium]